MAEQTVNECATPVKKCNKCDRELPIEQFPRDGRNPKWVAGRCRDCRLAYGVKYRQENRDRLREEAKLRRLGNLDESLKYEAEYRQNNREKIRASARGYVDRNRKKAYAATRKWQANNPEKCVGNRRKWEKRNRAKVRAKCARRTALKAGAKIGDQKLVLAFYQKVKSADRLPCYWCGKRTRKNDRHVDHIIPLDKGGAHTVTNLCCSCVHCNEVKHNRLPHEFSGQHVIEFPHA